VRVKDFVRFWLGLICILLGLTFEVMGQILARIGMLWVKTALVWFTSGNFLLRLADDLIIFAVEDGKRWP
jgi:hypothetical protein